MTGSKGARVLDESSVSMLKLYTEVPRAVGRLISKGGVEDSNKDRQEE